MGFDISEVRRSKQRQNKNFEEFEDFGKFEKFENVDKFGNFENSYFGISFLGNSEFGEILEIENI